MSHTETLNLAADIVEQSGHPEPENFARLMRSTLMDRKMMLRILDFFRYLQYEDKNS